MPDTRAAFITVPIDFNCPSCESDGRDPKGVDLRIELPLGRDIALLDRIGVMVACPRCGRYVDYGSLPAVVTEK